MKADEKRGDDFQQDKYSDIPSSCKDHESSTTNNTSSSNNSTTQTPPAEAKEASSRSCQHLNGKELIKKVCDFYFDDISLQTMLEKWSTDNCFIFSPFDTEYSLHQMTLFEEFRAILEKRLEK